MAAKDVKRPSAQDAARSNNSRQRRRKQSGKKTIHFILLIVFVLAAGTVLSLTTFFKIDNIIVIGTDKYSPSEIAASSGIKEGDNLLRISQQKVEQNLLEKYSYIEGIKINRKLPATVEIIITQSVAATAVAQGEDILLITKEGKVLERGKVLIPPDIPVIKGLETKGAQPLGYLGEEAQEGLKMLRYLLAAMEQTGFSSITNLDISDRLNMKVVYENRILLKLGSEADLAYKLAFVKKVIEQLEPDAQGTIDAANANEKKVVFKPGDIHKALEEKPNDTQALAGENSESGSEAKDQSQAASN